MITTSTTTAAKPTFTLTGARPGDARLFVRSSPMAQFWLAIGDEYAAEMKVLFHRELGLSPRSWVIWYYTFGVNCTRKFSRSHAHLFYFVNDPERFTFNDKAIRVPSARQLVYFDSRAESAKAAFPTTPGFSAPRTFQTGSHRRATPGMFPAFAAPSRSVPAGMAARCPSSFWAGSSVPARTPARSCSILLAAVAPRLSSPRNWTDAFSASSSLRITPQPSPLASKPPGPASLLKAEQTLWPAARAGDRGRRGALIDLNHVALLRLTFPVKPRRSTLLRGVL